MLGRCVARFNAVYDHMTDPAVTCRIRNQMIGYLALASSFEEQARYQRAAPSINVANEIINQWQDLVQEDWRSYITEPVFCSEEVTAVDRFHAAWDAVAEATPQQLPSLDTLWASTEWQLLAAAAGEALAIFQVRGCFQEMPDQTRSLLPSKSSP